MFDNDYMDADYEVISMVNRKRGPGGQLPRKTVTFIPAERAERVEALDLRIQQMQKIMPFVGAGAIALGSFLIGTMF